jgi:gliding motility-associated-like protein
LANFSILDNGQPFVNTSVCGNFVALPLDSGFHHISIRNNISTCDYAVQVQVNCPSVAASDTIRLSVALGAATEACLNGGLIGGQFISLENECGQQLNGNIAYTLNVGTQCVRISGENPGADTLCLLLCNTAGGCMRTAVFVEVLDIPVDTTFAVDDQAYTPRGQALDVDIIGNDFIQGATGNLGALESVALLDNPDKGSASYDPATGILRYLPDPQRCGLDSIRYQIRDSVGLESEARIFITIICGKILIYNGISPNGDGLNDVWTLPGIEQYPNNEVRLYSRWGTEVFSRKGYANANAWDGRWNGRDLPDGTYFYLINFGDGSEALSGWVQLLR